MLTEAEMIVVHMSKYSPMANRLWDDSEPLANDNRGDECHFCEAELISDMRGHEDGCPWVKAKLLADKLEDKVLRRVMDEVYGALNSGFIVLASIGTRTLIDRAIYLRVGDPNGGFAAKLKLMEDRGHIGADESEILEAMTDAGSAAAHRGYSPKADTLKTIIETVEIFLRREFFIKTEARKVKAATPPRNITKAK